MPEKKAFDVVVVADFGNEVTRRFEIMTLFFLASWLEYGGESRDFPLHLVCIGEAPHPVKVLAERCGATIHHYSPLLYGGFANKLRGLQIKGECDHVLLLDVDMLVLSDLSGLLLALGENCISAAAANGPCIVPPKHWKSAHELLGVEFPDWQLPPLNLTTDTFQCEKYRDSDYFPPFFNGGIVFAPWRSQLGDRWQDHLSRLSEVLQRKAKVSNQPPLATAITSLMAQGYDFKVLPDAYHGRWQHIAAGTLRTDELRLLHTIGFGRWQAGNNTNTAREEIDNYLHNILRLTRRLRSHLGPDDQAEFRKVRYLRLKECRKIHQRLELLYEKYVHELRPEESPRQVTAASQPIAENIDYRAYRFDFGQKTLDTYSEGQLPTPISRKKPGDEGTAGQQIDTLSILCCSDHNNRHGLFALVNSIVRNSSNSSALRLHVLVDKNPDYYRDILQTYFGTHSDYRIAFEVVSLSDNPDFADNVDFLENNMRSIGGPKVVRRLDNLMNYARIYLPEIFPQVDIGLYLDVDMIVRTDINILFDYDFLPMVAASPLIRPLEGYHPNLKMRGYGFNSGFLLADFRLWRKYRVTEAIEQVMRTHKTTELFKGGTQPLLNIVLYRLCRHINTSWNATALGWKGDLTEEELENAKVLHWTGAKKPWLDDGMYKELWQKYQIECP